VGCCLMGCLRLLFFQLWKVLLAALLAVVLARIDSYVERRYPESTAGKAWRAYRSRRKKSRSRAVKDR
jgi:protein-S-isoprenylcysteine O-methyltransferase Ste14